MTGPVFVDTNVLLYARDASERDKQKRANAWLVYLWRSRAGRLSMQVLYEFYVTVTEKLRPGIDRKAARRDVRNLMAWHPARLDRTVLVRSVGGARPLQAVLVGRTYHFGGSGEQIPHPSHRGLAGRAALRWGRGGKSLHPTSPTNSVVDPEEYSFHPKILPHNLSL